MNITIAHTEFANASPESVWHFWSNVSTWSQWDHGVQWCQLKPGHKFQTGGEGSLLPQGAANPVEIQITECTPNMSFVDEGKLELGLIQFSHSVTPYKKGVNITHSLTFQPKNPQAKTIFEQQILPKLQIGLPESVKSLRTLAEHHSLTCKSLVG